MTPILVGYLEAVLWTNELDELTIYDFTPEALDTINADIDTFTTKAGNLLDNIEDSQIGHDLWLTRNGHGAGFWDRGLGAIGDTLTEYAHELGDQDIEEFEGKVSVL